MKAFQPQESAACYNGISGIKNSDIWAKNGYFGNINQTFQDDIVVRPQCRYTNVQCSIKTKGGQNENEKVSFLGLLDRF